MPTFTRILNVFEDILREDPLYEVVSTSHGYTLLAWDEHRHQWYNAELMETPDAMLEALLVFMPAIWNSNSLGMSGMI